MGSYFAPNFSKSDMYTKSSDAKRDGMRSMLMCRVVAGEAYRAKEPCTTRTCPPDNPIDGNQFDSVYGVPRLAGGSVDWPELVVFRDTRILPMYIVNYSHARECVCRTCRLQFPAGV